MKNSYSIFLAVVILLTLAVIVLLNHKKNSVSTARLAPVKNAHNDDIKSNIYPLNENKSGVKLLSAIERQYLTDEQRLTYLENLGQLPDDFSMWDLKVVEKTSWWGKRLDPKTFWNRRVIWLDEGVLTYVHRRGRVYPPIPPGIDISHFRKSDKDRPPDVTSFESQGPQQRYSELERAFWDSFTRTHPTPPDLIERAQLNDADRIEMLHSQNGDSSVDNNIKMQKMISMLIRRGKELGYPPEAFTEEALHWAYVIKARNDYQQQVLLQTSNQEQRREIFLNYILGDKKLSLFSQTSG